jgi:hypothetical protein
LSQLTDDPAAPSDGPPRAILGSYFTLRSGEGAGERRSGAEARVTLVDARRDDVVAVPVAAIVDDEGSTAVRVVPVETGLVADGWVDHRGPRRRRAHPPALLKLNLTFEIASLSHV